MLLKSRLIIWIYFSIPFFDGQLEWKRERWNIRVRGKVFSNWIGLGPSWLKLNWGGSQVLCLFCVWSVFVRPLGLVGWYRRWIDPKNSTWRNIGMDEKSLPYKIAGLENIIKISVVWKILKFSLVWIFLIIFWSWHVLILIPWYWYLFILFSWYLFLLVDTFQLLYVGYNCILFG